MSEKTQCFLAFLCINSKTNPVLLYKQIQIILMKNHCICDYITSQTLEAVFSFLGFALVCEFRDDIFWDNMKVRL